MSIFTKVFDSLSEYEDDELWKTIYELLGPLTQLSLLFPSFRPSHRMLTLFLYSIFIAIMPTHSILGIITILRERDDVFSVCLLMNYWFILFYCIFATFNFGLPSCRKQMSIIIRFLSTPSGNYRHGDIYKEERPIKIVEEVRRFLLKFSILPVLVGIFASTLFWLPYLNNYNSGITYTDSGVNKKLPIPIYYPFPSDNELYQVLALGIQLVVVSIVAVVVIASILLYLRLAQRVKLEYQVLDYALDTLFKRTSTVYKQQNRNQRDIKFNNLEYQKCIGICLSECVRHHHQIKRLLSAFEEVLSWPAWTVYSISCLELGISVFALLNAIRVGDSENLLKFTFLIIGECGSLFVLSFIGEVITADGVLLREKLYNIQWYDFSQENKRIVLNFQTGVLQPAVLKAGVSTRICFVSFADVMNAAYSFFNIMNANME